MGIVSSDTISQDQTWLQDHTDDLIDTTSILNILRASLSQFYVLKAMKSQSITTMEIYNIHSKPAAIASPAQHASWMWGGESGTWNGGIE